MGLCARPIGSRHISISDPVENLGSNAIYMAQSGAVRVN